MESFFTYAVFAIIAFLGLIGGIIASYSNKKELLPGKRYFVLSQKILFMAVIIATVVLFELNVFLSFAIILAAFLFCFYLSLTKYSYYVYILFGSLFFIGMRNDKLFLLNCALVFLFGIPNGTLLTMKNKNIAIEIIKHLGFFICLLLFFVPL
jgi:hypothetical protein